MLFRSVSQSRYYESHHGPIPKDEDGRTYEIHHIDGNPLNNSIENLIALSIKDHYDIHYRQEDWIACFRIAKRMKISPQEKSDLARKSNLIQVANGTHIFQNKELAKSRVTKANNTKVANGTHHFLKDNRTFKTGRDIDSTLHTFENQVTGEIVQMNQKNFVETYSLNQGNVSSMIKNPRRSVKGWKVLSL